MQQTLTNEHVQALLDTVRGQLLEALITLALSTSIRRDEVVCLTWHDGALETGEIHVRASKTREDQTIRLPAPMIALLAHHRAQQEEAQRQAGSVWPHGILVFPDPTTGGPLDALTLRKHITALFPQAGIPHAEFHSLRATAWYRLRDQERAEHPSTNEALEREPPEMRP